MLSGPSHQCLVILQNSDIILGMMRIPTDLNLHLIVCPPFDVYRSKAASAGWFIDT